MSRHQRPPPSPQMRTSVPLGTAPREAAPTSGEWLRPQRDAAIDAELRYLLQGLTPRA
ncbi:hypothetical protein AB0A98_41735 [Streptomyces chrestomyceticus]|uniref:hypothetical protein n=1 Tax=Streptomyces chrestomyceticus TaxID=68185 RepID=UPI0033D4454A